MSRNSKELETHTVLTKREWESLF